MNFPHQCKKCGKTSYTSPCPYCNTPAGETQTNNVDSLSQNKSTSSNYKKWACLCFAISFLAIVAMFLTAASFVRGNWTVVSWIIEHFWYGYYGFILGAAVFAAIGVLLLKKEGKISFEWFKRHPRVLNFLAIVLLLLMIVLLFKMCGMLAGELGCGSSSSDVCGICGGSGVFQGKRCWCVGR